MSNLVFHLNPDLFHLLLFLTFDFFLIFCTFYLFKSSWPTLCIFLYFCTFLSILSILKIIMSNLVFHLNPSLFHLLLPSTPLSDLPLQYCLRTLNISKLQIFKYIQVKYIYYQNVKYPQFRYIQVKYLYYQNVKYPQYCLTDLKFKISFGF